MTTPRKPAAAKATVTKTAIPAGAKIPEDHAPKDDGKTRLNWKGKTWVIDDDAFDDISFLDAAENNRYVAMARLLLGDEGLAELTKLLKDPKTGRSKASELVKFVEAAGDTFEAKN